VLPKLQRIRKMIDATGRPIYLEVDGGVKPGIASKVVQAGADVLVAGSAVFGHKDYGQAIKALREDGQ
jgi:ribulose-phosphate 3-epimerase